MGVVDPGAGFLLPGGVLISLELGVGVAGHVPHVGDAGGGLAGARGGGERSFRLFVVPKVDAEVVARMHRLNIEHVLNQQVDRHVAADAQPLVSALPKPDGEEGLGLDVIRVVVNDRFEVAHHLLAAILLGLLGVGPVIDLGIDPKLFAFVGLVPAFLGFLNEFLCALGVVAVGHGHAPVGHGAVGIEHRCLPEAAFGLEVPKAVQLRDALREIELRLLAVGGDWKTHAAHAFHQVSALAGAFVERLSVEGVTPGHLLVSRFRLVCGKYRQAESRG